MGELRVTYGGSYVRRDHPYGSALVPVDDDDDDPDAYLMPFVDGLPVTGRNQSCGICGDHASWVHRLDPDKVTYREYGKGHTLPSFWTLCDSCEQAYQADDLDALVARSQEPHEDLSAEDLAETVRKPIEVFAAADLEVRPLQPSVRGPAREDPADALRREVQERLADAGVSGRFEVYGVNPGAHRRVSLVAAEPVTPQLTALLDAALDGIDYRFR
jgi:hypothetical protein